MNDSVIGFWREPRSSVKTVSPVIYHICPLRSLMDSYAYEASGREKFCDNCMQKASHWPNCWHVASYTQLMFSTKKAVSI